MIYKTLHRKLKIKQLKTGDELMCSGGVNSSCSTTGIHRLALVTNSVISHEWEKGREMLATSGKSVAICDTDIP
jgi:hypothetical protein